MSDKDQPSDLPVPSGPVGVIPALTPDDRLIPDVDLGSLDHITRTNLDVVASHLPQYVREKAAIEHVFSQLKAEIGVNESDEPTVRGLLDDTTRMLETLREPPPEKPK